ncbi:MAG: hypothetical protein ACKVT0_18335 [Planctomycetaceae bacterium]
MHPEPKALLKEALQKCLPALQTEVDKYEIPCQVWTKKGDGRWEGKYVLRPDLMRYFVDAEEQLHLAGQNFGESFLKYHPDYNGMVGSPIFGLFNFGQDITSIFRSAIAHLWNVNGKSKIDDTAIDSLVNEFELFIDKPTFRVIYRSQLLNFKSTGNSIELPQGLRIRRMTDSEMSGIYGGSNYSPGIKRSSTKGMHEYCIEGEIDEPKVLGQLNGNEQLTELSVKTLLDKAILSLRTFKGGCVGYDCIHYFTPNFCPLFSLPSHFYRDKYVPMGTYTLDAEEFEMLVEHSLMIFDGLDPSIEMACSRLADSEIRIMPRDQLVDAVIGMESILLAGLGKEDRKGELKFRFSLNYSTLFGTPEARHLAFRVAKDLYDLRSAIAHGSVIGDGKNRVGDENLLLTEAANRASESLRYLIRYFLPQKIKKPYKNHSFWERAYFGFADA